MYIKRHLMTKITASVDKTDKFVDQKQILFANVKRDKLAIVLPQYIEWMRACGYFSVSII